MDDSHRAFEEILRILNRVVGKISAMQQAPREYGTGVPLYGSEIHTAQAIGKSVGINVTRLAEKMGVTKGAASQVVSRLVEKGVVRKSRAEGNAKEVVLDLTELGRTGVQNHERFDMEIFESVREYCGPDLEGKLDTFLSVMKDFDAILTLHEGRHQTTDLTRKGG